MQKARLYGVILLVNRGIDEAIQGLERLKRTRNSGLDPACFDEKLVLFELQRASLNEYFCNNVERAEQIDVARFDKKHRVYQKNNLDEVQVYRDLLAVEDRRQNEGKAPEVRLLTPQEQRECERRYPKPPEDSTMESPEIEGRQS